MKVRKYTIKELKEKNMYIPMNFDPVFKRIWGDPNNLDRAAFIISKLTNIPYDDLLGKVQII